jgi:hypothetical protein
MPSQQRLGRDDPALASLAGERGGDRAEQTPVLIVEFGPVDLSAQDHELVAKNDDLEVLRSPATDSQTGKGSEEPVEDAKHGAPAWRHRAWSAPTRAFPSPTGVGEGSVLSPNAGSCKRHGLLTGG